MDPSRRLYLHGKNRKEPNQVHHQTAKMDEKRRHKQYSKFQEGNKSDGRLPLSPFNNSTGYKWS